MVSPAEVGVCSAVGKEETMPLTLSSARDSFADAVHRLVSLPAPALDESVADLLASANPALDQDGRLIVTSSNGSRLDVSSIAGQPAGLPLIEVQVHPRNLQTHLNTAPSLNVREAWLTGTPLPDQQRRLLLRPGPDLVSRGDLYAEGREWWQEHAEGWDCVRIR